MRNPSTTVHDIPEIKSPTSRYGGIAFVGALHIVAIWVIASGLDIHVSNFVPPVLKLHLLQQIQKPETDVALPPKPVFAKPVVHDTVPEPAIQLQAQPQQPAATATPQLPAPPVAIADSAATALTDTHTTPPYPPDARRLSQQGTVTLLLSVDATGAVTNAQVQVSSGYPELDQTAVSWVIAHWRYNPAIQNGVAVASTAQAEVKFNLTNAP